MRERMLESAIARFYMGYDIEELLEEIWDEAFEEGYFKGNREAHYDF